MNKMKNKFGKVKCANPDCKVKLLSKPNEPHIFSNVWIGKDFKMFCSEKCREK